MSCKNIDDNEALNFNEVNINYSKEVDIFGIEIDKQLTFRNHRKTACTIASEKLSTLLRIYSNLNIKQNVLSYKAMIKYQFWIDEIF